MSVVAFAGFRDVVSVVGPDAHSYLQSQLSQDLKSIGGSKCVAALLLDPSGKVDALVRVTYLAVDHFEVDIDAGFGDVLLQRLKRFKIRVNAELSLSTVPVVFLRGIGGGAYYDPTHPAARLAWWMDSRAVDVFGESLPDGIRIVDPDEFESIRIAAGWPAMGQEITGSELAAELGVVDIAVNFGKGCYPGQELVERMDSRQAVSPRTLCRIAITSADSEGVEVTSRSGTHVLGFVKRSVDRDSIGAVPVRPELS